LRISVNREDLAGDTGTHDDRQSRAFLGTDGDFGCTVPIDVPDKSYGPSKVDVSRWGRDDLGKATSGLTVDVHFPAAGRGRSTHEHILAAIPVEISAP
jgi:hypothetical protein